MTKLNTIVKGTAGIGSIELINIMPTNGEEAQELIKLIIQVAVGLATIYTMLRKKKEKK